MQFHKTWNTSFDQIFKAQSLLQKNNEVFQRPSTYQSTRKQLNSRPGTSRAFQIDELLRMITEMTYKSKSQILTLHALQKLPNITVKKYRQSIYYGQFINNCREGLGLMLYTNGRIYEGNWNNNYKHGKGYQRYENGAEYQGNYNQGKPCGYGRYSWQNGQSYEGEWKDGMKNGSGMWRGPAGDSYIGQWKNGQANGYGVHTWINGDRYQGQFENCLKHGQGIEKFNNGDSYKGMYKDGKPDGYGQYYWAVGSFFKGTFRNGLREGNGIWKSGPGNSDKYQGQYKADKKEGYGVFIWSNGNMYKGNYRNDLRDGYGQMYWNDGKFYKGNWQQGMQIGVNNQEFNDRFPEQIEIGQNENQFEDHNQIQQELVPTGINPNINKGFEVQNQKIISNNRWDSNGQNSKIFPNQSMRVARKMRNAQISEQNQFLQNNTNINQYVYEPEENNEWIYNEESYQAVPQKVKKLVSKNSPYLLNGNNYNFQHAPDCPIVQNNHDKKFRFRGSSKKSQSSNCQKSKNVNTQKQFIRSNPSKKIFFDNNFMEGGKYSKKFVGRKKSLNETEPFHNHSVRLRNNASSQSYKKKTRNQNPSSSQNSRNASQKMMMSSTFFLYKIHGNSQKDDSSNIKNRRVVKTSGGMRSKRQVQNAQYYQQHILGRQY